MSTPTDFSLSAAFKGASLQRVSGFWGGNDYNAKTDRYIVYPPAVLPGACARAAIRRFGWTFARGSGQAAFLTHRNFIRPRYDGQWWYPEGSRGHGRGGKSGGIRVNGGRVYRIRRLEAVGYGAGPIRRYCGEERAGRILQRRPAGDL